MSILTSILTGGNNNHTESAANANAVATDFISQGIVGAITNTAGVAPSTGGLAANAQGTPNTTTQVTAGTAYVTGTPTGSTSQTFRVVDNTGATVTHAANATGGTRYDWIYLQLDATKLLNPAVDASDVATYVTSRSTSSSTDNGTPPTYGYCIAVVTLANGFSTVTNANITDKRSQTGANSVATGAGVGSPQVAAGVPVQIVSTNYSAVATGTTIIPADDTIPQITEGDQYMTQAITPKSATNILIIEVCSLLSSSLSSSYGAIALFQDSTANALAVSAWHPSLFNDMVSTPLCHSMTAGTTSSITFKVRAGINTDGTTTFNGNFGGRLYGATTKSFIKITEVKV